MGATNSSEPPLCVRRYDGPGRFLVNSERPHCETRYLCELGNPEFPKGKCECDDWKIRIGSYLARGEEPEKEQCKHILRILAQIQHVATVCALAGIPYDERLIPAA